MKGERRGEIAARRKKHCIQRETEIAREHERKKENVLQPATHAEPGHVSLCGGVSAGITPLQLAELFQATFLTVSPAAALTFSPTPLLSHTVLLVDFSPCIYSSMLLFSPSDCVRRVDC